MKTTATEYRAKSELRRSMNILVRTAEDENDFSMAQLLKDSVLLLEAEYFNLIDKVFVSFCIGSRNYYREVVKVGKSYFSQSEKMTKGRGYWFITEIPSITDEMMDEMISDSHYY